MINKQWDSIIAVPLFIGSLLKCQANSSNRRLCEVPYVLFIVAKYHQGKFDLTLYKSESSY